MKYLETGGHQLDRIISKEFGYPRLTMYAGTDRNGLNEIEGCLRVWVPVPYGTMGLHMYSSISLSNEKEIREEVNLWNSDPKKYWRLEATRLLQEECSQLEERIKEDKADLKKYRKKLDKLQEKDK